MALSDLRFRKSATATACCPARRDGTTMASRIKRTAKIAWCNPLIRCLLAIVAVVSFPAIASLRTSDSDDVDTMVKSGSKASWWWSADCPGSFKFQFPHGDFEVPREHVKGVLQETLYTFRLSGNHTSKQDDGLTYVNLTSGRLMFGNYQRNQFFGKGKNTTGWVTWQPFDQRYKHRALFGGPGNKIQWSVAEKWHAISRTKTTTRPFKAQQQRGEPEGQPSSSWDASWLTRILQPLLQHRFPSLVEWWNSVVETDEQRRVAAILLYMSITDLGQQVVHVGHDKNLVDEGRRFAESNDGIPDQKMEKRFRERSDDLQKAIQSHSKLKALRPPLGQIESSGVSCLHFEPPKNRPFPASTTCGGNDLCKRQVQLPLRKMLFLYSGQTTLWPDESLGTLTGVAFLDVSGDHNTGFTLSAFVSIFTFAAMPPSMFVKVVEPKPAFYVGTLDYTEPSQKRIGTRDCRRNPLEDHSWVKKGMMKWMAGQPLEVLRRPATRPWINRTRGCNPCYSNHTLFYGVAEHGLQQMHDFANRRASGEDVLKDKEGRDALAETMRILHASFRCSGSYLWTPGDSQPESLSESLAWVHFMMETPKDDSAYKKEMRPAWEAWNLSPPAHWSTDNGLYARLKDHHLVGSRLDAVVRTWSHQIKGASCRLADAEPPTV
eukprot:TRINITY_DN15261_c0_g1_i1.p1 TRINITY_DN15261_c0_g1~~TRINITY_DN15261_c0_g1_i1.p1  ORF type:complete len:661 (-),score=34.78 TRINITY_DN15261_c0_g1_i1:387-2369(-)